MRANTCAWDARTCTSTRARLSAIKVHVLTYLHKDISLADLQVRKYNVNDTNDIIVGLL